MDKNELDTNKEGKLKSEEYEEEKIDDFTD
jgi:hypothetical protein